MTSGLGLQIRVPGTSKIYQNDGFLIIARIAGETGPHRDERRPGAVCNVIFGTTNHVCAKRYNSWP